MTGAYYNEFDPFAAAWLRNLIAANLIAPGDVDERDIREVAPSDLYGYSQVHLFAGIGGWSYALRLAGWADDRPVWTASCPCQPFSAAGKGAGFKDERHLWPDAHRLIASERPATVFGEQVASKDGLAWLDLVQGDFETSGYTFAAVDLGAASVGAPHIRQRLFWVADALSAGRAERWTGSGDRSIARGGAPGLVANTSSEPIREHLGDVERQAGEEQGEAQERQRRRNDNGDSEPVGELANANGRDAGAERQQRGWEQRQQSQDGGAGELADTSSAGLPLGSQPDDRSGTLRQQGEAPAESGTLGRSGPTNGHWRDADWLGCTDGKWRPVEPGTFPLAHGIPNRVGSLRGYGNAIVPQVAAEIIGIFMEYRP